ncbi:hypothetical protein [Desulfofundulus thermocisternus]|uniref:hypothetical protein n=1 Tax=Desulfofundulus thermocisternus TaxID=42471 RepID=UPI00217D64A5|nr:hypothetical protein [Desulfofundulus thermocisternus]MCS5697259.1 hypothetical protein [Desulfofundulus thermocisternus]
MENSAALIFHNANLFAVTMYPFWLVFRFLVCRYREHYPPWVGIKPWLQAVSAGVTWGVVVWMVTCYSKFLSHLLQAANFVSASLSFEKALGSWVVFFLPAILFFSAIDGIRKIYSWVVMDWNAADQKCWRLLILRFFACTGVMAGTGTAFTLALPTLLRALF